jgi:hypothetical protein
MQTILASQNSELGLKQEVRIFIHFPEEVWITYSMEQSPSWEANWSAASQEIPRILRNPNCNMLNNYHNYYY